MENTNSDIQGGEGMKIVIVGDGKIGSTLAEQLSREGHEVTIIDQNAVPLQQTVEDLDILCVEGNGVNVGHAAGGRRGQRGIC